MAWLYLALAIGLEVIGTTSMKLSDGFTRLAPSVTMFACYLMSLAALTMALKHGIELGVAYAVWGGLGIALIVAIGCVLFGESLTPAKAGFIGLIICGVVGLNVWGGAHAAEPQPPEHLPTAKTADHSNRRQPANNVEPSVDR